MKILLTLALAGAFCVGSHAQTIKDSCKRIDRPGLTDHLWIDNAHPMRFCAQVVPAPSQPQSVTQKVYIVLLWDTPTSFPVGSGSLEDAAITFVESSPYVPPASQQ